MFNSGLDLKPKNSQFEAIYRGKKAWKYVRENFQITYFTFSFAKMKVSLHFVLSTPEEVLSIEGTNLKEPSLINDIKILAALIYFLR